MQTYRVFNQNNALKTVTDADLDEASQLDEPLETHIANAAAAARRRDLIPQLRRTLAGTVRRPRLAAARALLAMMDRDSVPELLAFADHDQDAVVASIFRATALRLRSVAALRAAFHDDATPAKLKQLMTTIYPGKFDVTPEDLSFLIEVLSMYLDGETPWMRALDKDAWQTATYGLVSALTLDPTRGSPESPREPPESLRGAITKVLTRVMSSRRTDRETKLDAKTWLKAYAASG